MLIDLRDDPGEVGLISGLVITGEKLLQSPPDKEGLQGEHGRAEQGRENATK